MYDYFKQNCATAHTASFSMAAIQDIRSKQITVHRLLPSRHADLNSCDYNSKTDCQHFKTKRSIMCWEIFTMGVRPALKLQVSTSRLFYKVRSVELKGYNGH